MAKKLSKNRSNPSTTAEDRQVKRLHILEAAAAEFALLGFDTASVESIAERAGIGKGTIYNYTGGKDQLFSECLQLICDELRQVLGETMEETVNASTEAPLPEPEALQRVALISDRLADLARRRHDFVTIYFGSLFGVNPRGRDLVVQSARDIITGLKQLFVIGQAHAIIRDSAPADMIASLIFLNRLVFSRMLDGLDLHAHSPAEQAKFLFDMHWRGMKAEPAP